MRALSRLMRSSELQLQSSQLPALVVWTPVEAVMPQTASYIERMDSRSAAHVLTQIGALLEAKGEQRFKARAYDRAARALVALDTDDLAPLVKSGELAATSGIGPATLSVIRELLETGESSY